MSVRPSPSPAPIEPWELLDLLTSLVQKSLVLYEEDEQGRGRYRLLETVRQYARDRLVDAGEAESVRNRYLDFFLAWAEKEDPDRNTRADRLAGEHDNFRAALDWCRARPEGGTPGLRLMNALWWSWMVYSRIREGYEYLIEFLAQSSPRPPFGGHPVLTIHPLRGYPGTPPSFAGYPAGGELSSATRPEAAEPEFSSRLDDTNGVVVSDETFERARALNQAGFLANKLGRLAEARMLIEQSIEIGRGLGREAFVGSALNNLGDVASNGGDSVFARQCYEESLAIRRKRGDRWGIGWSLIHLGRLARLGGDLERAAALDQESLALFRETDDQGSVAWAWYELGKLRQAQNDLGGARSCYEEVLSLGRELLQNPDLPMYLEAFASLLVAQGEAERAARLYGAAARAREARSTPLLPSERTEYEPGVAAARTALGGSAFDRAWSEGRALTIEQAIQEALKGQEARS